MKCKIQGRQCFVVEATPEELYWLDLKLTWKGYPIVETAEDPKTGELLKTEVIPIEKLLFKEGEFYWFYSGLFQILKELHDHPMELVDNPSEENYKRVAISKNIFLHAPEPLELMGFQVAAAQKAAMLKVGISCIPTSGGKTEIILALLRYLLDEGKIRRALLVVPSVGLCEQLVERAHRRGFVRGEIGMVSGKAKEFDNAIVVAVVNSLNDGLKYNKSKVVELIQNVDFVGYDETHHLRAASWLNIAHNAINAEYLLGWSGSPLHSKNVLDNSGDALIMGLMGRIIFTETYDHLKEIGLISEPVVLMRNVPGRFARFMASFNFIYDKFILNYPPRNDLIVEYASLFARSGFVTLILVQRKEHAANLMAALSEFEPVSIFGGDKGLRFDAHGNMEDWEVNSNTFRKDCDAGMYKIVIASQVMDEGWDIPSLGAVIMGGGGKSGIKLTQRLGRGLRRKKVGRNRVYIIDFNDLTHVFLSSHSKKRKAFYEESGAVMLKDHYQLANLVHMHAEELRSLNED